jgi:hypothetical protein
MRMNARRKVGLCALTVAGLAGSAQAQTVVPAQIVYMVGDEVPGTGGATITAINAPFTDGNGRMAAFVSLGTTRRAILDENLNLLFDSDTVTGVTVVGGEGTIGISNAGGYIYSPSINGNDGVFSNGGSLLVELNAAPGLPGQTITFCSRPRMLPNGTAYWMSGLTPSPPGRAIYVNPTPSNPAATTVLMKGGDVYGGLTTTSTGLSFDFSISDNQLNRIHVLTATGSTATDTYVAANDVLVAREGSAAPVGLWSGTIRNVSINNSGTWVLSGDTTFATTTQDEVLVSNSGLILQEGTVVDGLAIAGTVNAVSINNLGEVAFTWGSGATEMLGKGTVASMPGSTVKLAQVGDTIDTSGDSVGDYTIVDFEASPTIGPGLDLADDGRVFVEVTIRPVGGTSIEDREAILVFGQGSGGCNRADLTDIGDTGAGPDGQLTVDDIIAFVNTFGDAVGCPGAAPCNRADITDIGDTGAGADGQLTVDDIIAFVNAFGDGC